MLKKSFLIKIPKKTSIYIIPKKRFLVIKSGFNSFILKNFDFKLIKIKNKIEFLYIKHTDYKNYKKRFCKTKKINF